MDTVFRILHSAGVEIATPPFPVNQLPDVSRTYLQKVHAKEGSKVLGKIKYYGKSEDIKEGSWTRYLTNVVAIPVISGVAATFVSCCFQQSLSHIIFPVGIGLTGMAVVYTAYLTKKVFSQLDL